MLGICNGFQVLCESGLLPGALLTNEGIRFVCRQVELVAAESGLPAAGGDPPRASASRSRSSTRAGASSLPRRCSTGSRPSGQVAFRYAPGQNPNGSSREIAGVTNEAGNVLGLMPHPEHAVDALTGSTDGLRLFESIAGAPV